MTTCAKHKKLVSKNRKFYKAQLTNKILLLRQFLKDNHLLFRKRKKIQKIYLLLKMKRENH